jgi:preprotein translocase SecE subunit
LAAYRPDQGIYARIVAGATALLLALFASVRVYHLTFDENGPAIPLLGMGVPSAAIWASIVFVVLAFVIFLFTYGLRTGLAALDKTSHALIDLLIDTQAELAKVSWPGREELVRSTAAVLVSMVLLGAFLVSVDWVVISALRMLGVLPAPS